MMKGNIQLPNLPYDYHALEPVISAEILELHHSKHHRAYVNHLNAALEKYDQAQAKNDLEAMIALQSAIRFNGGGHINHSIFWTNLGPVSQGAGQKPTGKLAQAIDRNFGSFEAFKEKFNAAASAIQGSGWQWLCYNPSMKTLQLLSCSNHDLPSSIGLVPILTVDVWEHAYYLQYKNVRSDFIQAVWQVFNWKNMEERFDRA